MALSEEEKKKIEERRAAAARAQQKWAEIDKQTVKPAAQASMPSASALSAGKNAHSMTGNRAAASAAVYQKNNEGDNNMAKAASMYRREAADYANMTYEDAMGFATRIVYDDERDAFLKKWQSAAGKQGSRSYMESVPTMDEMRTQLNLSVPGGLYRGAKDAYAKQTRERFEDEFTAKKTLHVFEGMTDVNGRAVNMNSAGMDEIVRAIRAEPSSKRRYAYADAMETLVNTPGTRFYGMAYDKGEAKAFLNSAALSQDRYDTIVERYESLFDPREGKEQENADAMRIELERIEAGGYDPYVKKAYMDALSDAYMSQTGKDSLPDVSVPAAQAEPGAEKTGKSAQKEEKKGWFASAADAASSAVGSFFEKSSGMMDEIADAAKRGFEAFAGVFPEEKPKGAVVEWQGAMPREIPSYEDAKKDKAFAQEYARKKKEEADKAKPSVVEWQGAMQREQTAPPTLRDAFADEAYVEAYRQQLLEQAKAEAQAQAKTKAEREKLWREKKAAAESWLAQAAQRAESAAQEAGEAAQGAARKAGDAAKSGMQAAVGAMKDAKARADAEKDKPVPSVVEWQGAPHRATQGEKAPTFEEMLSDEAFLAGYAAGIQEEAQAEEPEAKEEPQAQGESLFTVESLRRFMQEKVAKAIESGEDIGSFKDADLKNTLIGALESGEYARWQAQEEETEPEAYGPPKPAAIAAGEKERELPRLIDTIYAKYGKPDAKRGMGAAGGSGDVNLTEDLGRAWFEYKEAGRFNELDRETQDALSELYQDDTVRAWMGMLGDAEFSRFATTDERGMTLQELGLENADYLFLENSGKVGATMMEIAQEIYDESFPEALRGDAFMAGIQLIEEAQDWAKSDAFVSEVKKPDLVNVVEEYIRLHGGESASYSALTGAVEAADRMKAQAAQDAQLAAENEAKTKEMLLENARTAVANRAYTQEQLALVEESAPEMDEAKRLGDAMYKELFTALEDEFLWGESAWMDNTVLEMAEALGGELTASTEMDWANRTVAQGYVEDVLRRKMDAAAALGMNLEEYASLTGDITLKSLQAQARLDMLHLGAQIDPVDIGIVEEDVRYKGSGKDATVGDILYASAAHGAAGAAADPLEAFYTWAAGADLSVDSARAKAIYDNDYGLSAQTQMRADLYAMIDGGYFPNEEMAQFIGEYLNAGGDPFALGILPDDLQFVRKSAVSLRQTQKAYAKWAEATLNEKQGMGFEVASGVTDNAIRQTLSAVIGYGTGSAFVGAMVGYGSASFNEGASMIYGADAQKIKETGKVTRNTQKWANLMGFTKAAATAASEYVTLGKWAENAKELFSVGSAARLGMNNAGISGVSRVMLGAARFVRAFAENEFDEVFVDEFKEGLLDIAAEETVLAMREAEETGGVTPITALKSTVKGAMKAIVGADDVLKATFDNAGMMALTVAPMAILGAGGAMKKAMPKTYEAAKKMTAGGRAEAAAAFVKAFVSETESAPQAQIDAANAALHDAAVGEEAAAILLTDPEIEPERKTGMKAQEQEQAHADSERNSAKAAQDGLDVAVLAQEQMNAGDTNPELVTQVANGVAAHEKNSQSVIEHRREREQKKAEMDAAFAEGAKKAAAKSEARVSAREEAAAQRSGMQARLEQIDAEIENFNRAGSQLIGEGLDDDAAMQYFEETLESLFNERAEIEAYLEEQNAPQIDQTAVTEQREAAQAALDEKEAEANAYLAKEAEREKAQQEADEMLPIYQSLARTKVYVDDTQKANILSRTGLKTLQQVNRKYGLKLVTGEKNKRETSLDGSFFTQLSDLAPGRVAQDVTVAEDALMDIVERKKQLKGMQASVGETAYEKYLPDGTFFNIKDPVMQQLTSDVKKATGVDIVVAPLAGNVRAIYDRAEKRIVINNRIGAGEVSKKVVMHELTHYIEGSAGYDAYKEAVLAAAYAHDADGSARAADERRILETYKDAGVALDEAGIESELVAEATEKIITDPDGRLTRELLGQKQKGLLYNLVTRLGQFLARKRAKKAGNLEQYEMIQTAYERLKEALRSGGGSAESADPTVDLDAAARRRGEVAHAGEDGQMQFAIVQDAKGRKRVKADRQVVFSDDPAKWNDEIWDFFEKEIRKNGNLTIYADDGDELVIDEVTQWHSGSRRPGSDDAEYQTKLNASAHMDELAQIAKDRKPNEPNVSDRGGKHGPLAEDGWRYKTAVFEDYDGKLYRVTLSVAHGEGIKTLYNVDRTTRIGDKKTGAAGRGSSGKANSPVVQSGSGNTSLPQKRGGVNPYSTQNGPKYSLAPNQFGNKTAQELDTIDEAVKDILLGSRHEVIGNEDRLKKAWEAVNMRGLDTVADELLSLPVKSWGAQENISAALCAVLANRNGDLVTAAAILTRYDAEGTVQGQDLQARQVIKRLSPEGAMLEMIRKADRSNAKKGIPAGSFPMGEDAPKKMKGSGTGKQETFIEKTPPAVQEVYHEADELKEMLSSLPGDVSYDNPWRLPLAPWQMKLIREFSLLGEVLPGIHYNVATRKQRMLAAIIAADPAILGEGQMALCQQLIAIKKGYAVVTAADLMYTASQMAELRYQEGADAVIPKTQAGKEALGRALQAQDNVAAVGFMKKWQAFRYANMLSAPATMVRNVAGNVIAGTMEDAATRVAVHFDKKIAKKSGTRTTAAATKDERKAANKAFAAEVVHTVSDYVVAKVDTGHGRKYQLGGEGRVFETGFLETYRNMVDFAMQIGDRPFFEQKYTEEKAIIDRLGMKKTETTLNGTTIQRDMTPEEIHEEATVRALHRVFQEDNAVVSALNSLRGKNPLADLAITALLPFSKTPMNVAMRALEYSPVGLMTEFARKAVFGMDNGKMLSISQRDYVMALGRGLTGTGLAVAGLALAAAGILLRGREEEDNAAVSGIQKALGVPYGMYLKIGDTMREIDWAMPVASAIAIGADLYYALEDGEGFGDALLTAMMGSLGGQILDTPMLSAMNDIFRGYDDAENIGARLAKTMGESLVNQTFSPAIIRAIAKATDPYVRDTGSESYVMGVLNKSVIQYWPGLRQMLPKAVDVTGDDVLAGGYYSWGKENQNAALHFLDSFFTPTATIGEKNDEALFTLLDQAYRTGDTSFLLKTIVGSNGKLTINKSLAQAAGKGESAYDMMLSTDERIAFNRMYGDILFNGTRGARYDLPAGFEKRHKVYIEDGIRKMIANGEWDRMTDEERADTVSAMKSAVKELVSYMAIMGEL